MLRSPRERFGEYGQEEAETQMVSPKDAEPLTYLIQRSHQAGLDILWVADGAGLAFVRSSGCIPQVFVSLLRTAEGD